MCIALPTHTHTRTHARTHTCTHTHTRTHAHAHTHTLVFYLPYMQGLATIIKTMGIYASLPLVYVMYYIYTSIAVCKYSTEQCTWR